jgi:hypothetical protein
MNTPERSDILKLPNPSQNRNCLGQGFRKARHAVPLALEAGKSAENTPAG